MRSGRSSAPTPLVLRVRARSALPDSFTPAIITHPNRTTKQAQERDADREGIRHNVQERFKELPTGGSVLRTLIRAKIPKKGRGISSSAPGGSQLRPSGAAPKIWVSRQIADYLPRTRVEHVGTSAQQTRFGEE